MKKIRNVILCTIVLAIILLLTTTTNASNNLTVSDINVVVTNTKAELEWSKANDADGYEVYVDIPSVGYLYVGKALNNKVTIIGFEEGEIYGVKVKAYNENGTSSTYSPEIRFKIGEDTQTSSELGTVKNIKAVSNGATGTIEWDKVTNADGYEIYASVQNSDYIDIGSTTSTKVRLIGMDEDEVYSIKIKPYLTKSNEKVYGSFSDLAILKYEEEKEIHQELDRVANLKSSMNGDKATLTWNKVANADGYEVLVQIAGYREATYTVSNNKITLTGFTAGYTYKTKVRAYEYVNGEKEYGAYSSTLNIKIEEEEEEPEEPVKLSKVTGLKVTMNGSEGRFTWNRVANADGYELSLNIPGTSPDTIIDATGTSKTIKGFTHTDTNYSAKVRAYKVVDGEKVYGSYSNKVSFRNTDKEDTDGKDELSRVTGVKVKRNGTKATMSWNKVNGATGYEIILNIPGYGESHHTVNGTSTTMSGFTTTAYKYTIKVRAFGYIKGRNVYSDYSNEVKF